MAQIEDDGFHEIQLNGKQLVFLFMTVTVVSVVIFLTGVLFGRGVRAERSVADASTANAGEVTPQPPVPSTPPPAASDPTKAAAPAADDETKLLYWQRLEDSKHVGDKLKSTGDGTKKDLPPEKPKGTALAAPAVEKPAPTPAPVAAAPEKRPPANPTPAPETRAQADAAGPSGSGFAVQVAALNLRSEADAIAKRLTAKGYSAYVLAPPTGTPSVFRVRVGKFGTRHEADTVAAKLQKEEQFKPWVTR